MSCLPDSSTFQASTQIQLNAGNQQMVSNTVNHPQTNDMANPNLPSNPHSHSDDHNDLASMERDIVKERLRQAHDCSDMARVMTGAFGVVSLFGVVLLLFGKVPAGTLTTIGGLASTIGCHQLAKDANDRLDKISAELNHKH
jgi:hypothetical protein